MFDFFNNFIDTFGKSQPKVTAVQKGTESLNQHRSYVQAKIRAIEQMESETDPKIKRRMQLLIEEGIYDFTGIENF